MQRTIFIIILALSVGIGAARAQVTSEPATTSATEGGVKGLRDPFWPVGWVPPKQVRPVYKTPEVPEGPVRWEEVTRKLEVSALSQLPDGRHVAVLKNIGLVESGDTISVSYGGMTYRWEVQAVTASGIQTKRLGVSAQRGK